MSSANLNFVWAFTLAVLAFVARSTTAQDSRPLMPAAEHLSEAAQESNLGGFLALSEEGA